MTTRLLGVIWEMPKKLIEIIEAHAIPGGCVINFRDTSYSPVLGGYHPVEIMVDKHNQVRYITDFAFVGIIQLGNYRYIQGQIRAVRGAHGMAQHHYFWQAG